MPGGRRGLVAPQNTFLENIIRRCSQQREFIFPLILIYLFFYESMIRVKSRLAWKRINNPQFWLGLSVLGLSSAASSLSPYFIQKTKTKKKTKKK